MEPVLSYPFTNLANSTYPLTNSCPSHHRLSRLPSNASATRFVLIFAQIQVFLLPPLASPIFTNSYFQLTWHPLLFPGFLKAMPVTHQDISTSRLWESAATSSTKPMWQSAEVSEITSWYESTNNSFMGWMRCKSMVIRSKQLLSPASHHGRFWHHCHQQKVVVLIPSFLGFCPSVPHSDFHILCVGSQYIQVGRLHSEVCSHTFSGDWTPGDMVKPEVFKRLHGDLGRDITFHTSISNDNLWQCTGIWRQFTSNLNLANLLHPRQLGESFCKRKKYVEKQLHRSGWGV